MPYSGWAVSADIALCATVGGVFFDFHATLGRLLDVTDQII
jgi:hypothetical protein